MPEQLPLQLPEQLQVPEQLPLQLPEQLQVPEQLPLQLPEQLQDHSLQRQLQQRRGESQSHSLSRCDVTQERKEKPVEALSTPPSQSYI